MPGANVRESMIGRRAMANQGAAGVKLRGRNAARGRLPGGRFHVRTMHGIGDLFWPAWGGATQVRPRCQRQRGRLRCNQRRNAPSHASSDGSRNRVSAAVQSAQALARHFSDRELQLSGNLHGG